MNLYERDGEIPLDIQCYGITIGEFNFVSSASERIYVLSFEDGLRYSLSLNFFDGILFGVADVYGHNDLSASSVLAVREFFASGNKVVIFTHSTIWHSDTDRHAFFNSLVDIHNILTAPQAIYDTFNVVYKYTRATHPILSRPFVLPETLNTSYTHRRGQIPYDNEIIYVGLGYTNYEGIYLSCHRDDMFGSYGLFINYGHESTSPLEWEAKATINALFLTHRDTLVSGIYTSNVFELDLSGDSQIILLDCALNLTGNGTATIRIRSSPDGTTFSEWILVTPEIRCDIPVNRYFQYQLLLAGMTVNPPVVHSVSFRFAKVSIQAEILYPLPNSISACPSQDIRFRLRSTNGLDSSSVMLEINGEGFTISSPQIELDNDTVLVYYPEFPYTHGQRITAILFPFRDTLGFYSEDTVSTMFVVDLQPPYVDNFYPSVGAILESFPESLWFNIFEDISTINWDSVYIILNTDTFRIGSPELHINGSMVVLQPNPALYNRNGEYEIRIGGIRDSPQLCEPNKMREFSYRFFVGSYIFSLPETTAFPGETLFVPLYSAGNEGLFDSIKVGISVDSTVCSFVGVLNDGWASENRLTLQRLTSGFLQFVVTGNVLVRNGIMCHIKIKVLDNAHGWDFSQLKLEEVLANASYSLQTRNGFLGIRFVPVDWLVDIRTVSAENNASIISFGLSINGTSGFDPGLDRIYLPQPPGWLSAYFRINDERYPFILGLSRDIRGRETIVIWDIHITSGDGEFQWEPRELPPGELIINGQDMRFYSSITVEEGDEIRISFRAPELLRFTGELKGGWNLVSVPFSLARADEPERIYPTMIGQPFHYVPSVGYRTANVLEYGKGYFILSSMNWTIDYAGRENSAFTIVLHPGWNMIGAPYRSIPFETSLFRPSGAIIDGMLYGYSPETFSYFSADSLIAGKGYFIFALATCTLSTEYRSSRRNIEEDFIRFNFLNGAKLYLFLKSKFNIPIPPSIGNLSFIAPRFQFDGENYLALPISYTDEFNLILDENSGFYVEIPPEEHLSLDLISENYILSIEDRKEYQLQKGVYRIKINKYDESLVLELFPNPLNAEGKIRIRGCDGMWRIEVFNILGQQVRKIEGNGNGIYSVDMKQFPSGIYFFKLFAGGKVIGKRVFVLR